MELKGKVVWITGASSGIGEALAVAVAAKGAKLVLSARRNKELERVSGLLDFPSGTVSENCMLLPLDLSQPETFLQKVNEVLSRFGVIDVLVNNAGVSQRSLARETGYEIDRQLMDINYTGTVALTKAVLPHFIKASNGLFVTITSAVGKFGSPWRSGYSASKHALHGFFDSLRAEEYDNGIRVLLVCPGFIATNVSVNALGADGLPTGVMDSATASGLTPQECARQIINAIKSGKEEIAIAGAKEKFGLFMKRFFPSVFSIMIRRMKVR